MIAALPTKTLFNPNGDDSVSKRQLIHGNSTNILNLNNVRFKWATNLYRKMVENFWIPEKVDMTNDVADYSKLTEHEQRAFDATLSFLIFLDSVQTQNIPRLADYVTAPEVTLCLTVQAFQEAIHAKSYQYIIESTIPPERRNSIYDHWRDNHILYIRNQYIAAIFQEFVDFPTEISFLKAAIANYLLESLYFYNGFNFFFNLASRHLMQGAADIIRYIARDEQTHIVIFERLIAELRESLIAKKVIDSFYYNSLVKEMMSHAVIQEIEWADHLLGNNILGVSTESTDTYTKYLANVRLQKILVDRLYLDDKYEHNPYEHLERLSDNSGEGEIKANFFESTPTSYNLSSAVAGWDDL
jgi:ribonucleoside-diphosphate reductase beta chain